MKFKILFITLLVTFITGCTFQPTLRIGEIPDGQEVYAGEYIIEFKADGPFTPYPRVAGTPTLPAGTYRVDTAGEYTLFKPTASILATGTVPYNPDEDFCLINKIENCEPNWVLKAQTNDPLLPTMWNYNEFHFEKAWGG